MISLPHLGHDDALRVIQSIGQAIRSDSARGTANASFFPTLENTDELSPGQRDKLATLATGFFCLPAKDKSSLARTLPALPLLQDWARTIFAVWNKNQICFQTSGSTGEPREHCFDMALMAAELQAASAAFTGRERIVSVMPVHHIFGFMYGPLLARYLNIPIVYAPPLPLASFFHLLRPKDLVVGFPFFWQALLDMVRREHDGQGLFFPPNVGGLTATSPCPPEIIHGLLNLKATGKGPSLAGMAEIYGATETNGLGLRGNGEEWYSLFPVWEPAQMDDGSRGVRRILPNGGRGPAQPMPDHIAWLDERRFKPLRRADNAVQIGGTNVYPERVAAIIREHPLVKDCAVRLMRPDEGARLKAFIVPTLPPDEATQAFGKPFREWLAARFETAWRPKRITFGEQLPVNNMGKARDWE